LFFELVRVNNTPHHLGAILLTRRRRAKAVTMPKAITHAQMAAATAAGEPRPEWCFRANPAAWPPYQIEWLAMWRPDAKPLPPVYDVVRRSRAWKTHREAHKRALAASALCAERVVDLRPPPLPPGPGAEGPPPPPEADDPEFYLVCRGLLVADSWRLEHCQEISEIFVEEPVLTPSGKHARRALRARLAGGGGGDGGAAEEEVEDFVRYSLEPGGRASDRKRRRKKDVRRERVCLRRLNYALCPRTEAAEEEGEEGEEVADRKMSMSGTATRPPSSTAYCGGGCVAGILGFLGVSAYSTGY